MQDNIYQKGLNAPSKFELFTAKMFDESFDLESSKLLVVGNDVILKIHQDKNYIRKVVNLTKTQIHIESSSLT